MALITETYLRAQLIKGLANPFPVTEGDKLTPAAADFLKERGIPLLRVAPEPSGPSSMQFIPVGVSNRHVHLAPDHIEALFGKGYKLTPLANSPRRGNLPHVKP